MARPKSKAPVARVARDQVRKGITIFDFKREPFRGKPKGRSKTRVHIDKETGKKFVVLARPWWDGHGNPAPFLTERRTLTKAALAKIISTPLGKTVSIPRAHVDRGYSARASYLRRVRRQQAATKSGKK